MRITDTYWCHECKRWEMVEPDDDLYRCLVCGESIACDECGQLWTDDHKCKTD